jgi:hypothetical protein
MSVEDDSNPNHQPIVVTPAGDPDKKVEFTP